MLYISRLKIKHKFKNKGGEYGELSEWSTRKKNVYVFLDFRVVIIKKGEIVEAMPSKVILMMPKNSRIKRKIQEKFQVSSFQESRIKNNQEQDSRLKIQESREDLIKISMKRFFQKLSSTWIFLKTCLPKSFYSLVIDYQIVVIDYQ